MDSLYHLLASDEWASYSDLFCSFRSKSLSVVSTERIPAPQPPAWPLILLVNNLDFGKWTLLFWDDSQPEICQIGLASLFPNGPPSEHSPPTTTTHTGNNCQGMLVQHLWLWHNRAKSALDHTVDHSHWSVLNLSFSWQEEGERVGHKERVSWDGGVE